MTDIILFGVWISILPFFGMPLGSYQYKRTLLLCAQHQTAEKLLDGNFYYLIPEKEYVEYIVLKNKEQA